MGARVLYSGAFQVGGVIRLFGPLVIGGPAILMIILYVAQLGG